MPKKVNLSGKNVSLSQGSENDEYVAISMVLWSKKFGQQQNSRYLKGVAIQPVVI